METAVDNQLIKKVQDSYGRCLSSGDMFETFYQKFLASDPEIKVRFSKTEFTKQKKLLKHGLNLMIMFAADNFAGKSGLKRIRESHNRTNLNIQSQLYGLWKGCLLEVIKEHDYKFGQDIHEAWVKVIDKGVKYIKGGYW